MIQYEPFALEDIPNRILEIDVSERGRLVYCWREGRLATIDEEWQRPLRTENSWQGTWASVLGLQGVKAWAAFDQEQLVGLIVYRPWLTEQMAQLAALFVDRQHRRHGIATQLTAEVCRQAREDGHSHLYVSATPSVSAVNFYRSQGFVPTQDVHPELYRLEPDDIHMLLVL